VWFSNDPLKQTLVFELLHRLSQISDISFFRQ
jgi:hypothetical protein